MSELPANWPTCAAGPLPDGAAYDVVDPVGAVAVLVRHSEDLMRWFCGESGATCVSDGGVLTFESGGRSVVFAAASDRADTLRAARNYDFTDRSAVFVGVDGAAVTIVRKKGEGFRVASRPSQALRMDVAVHGSVWETLFPAHRAILARTYAVSFAGARRGPLFRLGLLRWIIWNLTPAFVSRRGGSVERLSRSAIGVLTRSPHTRTWGGRRRRVFEVSALDELFDAIGANPGSRVFQTSFGGSKLTKYAPPYSKLLHFRPDPPDRDPTRRDYVVEYPSLFRRKFFPRDYVVLPKERQLHDRPMYEAMADISNILAIRRSGLFQVGLGKRVYTVVFPPALVELEAPEPSVLLTPCLVCYRVPFRPTFRPTFTVSFIAIPVSTAVDGAAAGDFEPAVVDLEMIHRLNNNLGQVVVEAVSDPGRILRVSGPLEGLIAPSALAVGLPGLVDHLLQQIVRMTIGGDGIAGQRKVHLERAISESREESHLSSLLLQVNWASSSGEDDNPWEEFIRTGLDPAFRRAIHQVMFFADAHDRGSALTTPETTRFDRFQISNSMGDDLGGMTFFDPDSETKYLIYPESREEYPNFSILRWLGFAIYSDSALASLRSMLSTFSSRVSARSGLRQMTRSMERIIENFAELYDLEIKRHIYRQEYERLKSIMRIDIDYAQLSGKISALTQAASLREQRLVNSLIVVIAGCTLSATVIAVAASSAGWDTQRTALVAGVAVSATAVLSLVVFWGIRRILDRHG